MNAAISGNSKEYDKLKRQVNMFYNRVDDSITM